MGFRFGAALGVVAVLWSAPALADDTHYQDFLVGARAVGMGGAYTAIADDSSGVYYNPAGLADAQYSSLQLSTSLYGFERGAVNGAGSTAPGVPSLNSAFTNLIVVPASAGSVYTFGEKDELGHSKQGIGLSVIVPSYRSTSPTSANGVDGNTTTYRQTITDRELWAGIGYGRRITDKLRIGISGFYVIRSVTDSEQLSFVGANPNTNSTQFETVTNNVSLSSGSIVLIGGAKWSLTPRWNIGVSVRTPSIQTNAQGSLQYTRATSDPTAAPALSNVTSLVDNRLKADTKQPAMFRFGATREREGDYAISFDVSGYLPTTYDLVNLPAGEIGLLPFATHVHRKAVMNANVGGEYYFADSWTVSGGAYTDFATSPQVSSHPTGEGEPHVNLYGMTAALGYIAQYTITRAGLLYSFGSGKDVLPSTDLARLGQGGNNYAQAGYKQSFLYFYLSSTFRY